MIMYNVSWPQNNLPAQYVLDSVPDVGTCKGGSFLNVLAYVFRVDIVDDIYIALEHANTKRDSCIDYNICRD